MDKRAVRATPWPSLSSWRQSWARVGTTGRNLRGMFQSAWQTQPWACVAILVLELIAGAAPLATAWITKQLLDQLSLLLMGQGGAGLPAPLLGLILLQAVLTVSLQVSQPLQELVRQILEQRLSLQMRTQVLLKLTSLQGLAPFEDPQLHNRMIHAAESAQMGPMQALQVATTLVRNGFTVISFVVVLFAVHPLLLGILGLALAPELLVQLKLGRQRMVMLLNNTPDERQAGYYHHLLTHPMSAKEVRLFTLSTYFIAAFQRLTQRIQAAQLQHQRHDFRWRALLHAFSSAIASGCFILVVLQAAAQRLSIGDVLLYSAAILSLQQALSSLSYAVANLEYSLQFYAHHQAVLDIPEPLALDPQPLPVPPLKQGIELRNVWFRYQPDQPWVLQGVNLTIPAGQCVALVGLNGAGKSTIVKLLARLYDPTEGAILWDGIDIRRFDPPALRQAIGAIFQDFLHYDLSAHANIAVGDVRAMEDRERVVAAARQSGIHPTLAGLPQGYDTLLSLWLGGEGRGVDLSGGQWQKIALARMFIRPASVLMLDEPTAALDVESEYALYHQFATLTRQQTSILITHRLSTVQMADCIVVLSEGRIQECGTHADLLAQGGAYARLYTLQASQYAGAAEPHATPVELTLS